MAGDVAVLSRVNFKKMILHLAFKLLNLYGFSSFLVVMYEPAIKHVFHI